MTKSRVANAVFAVSTLFALSAPGSVLASGGVPNGESSNAEPQNNDDQYVQDRLGISAEDLKLREIIDEALRRLVNATEGKVGAGGVWLEWDPLRVIVGVADNPGPDVASAIESFPFPDLLRVTPTPTDVRSLLATSDELVALRDRGALPLFDVGLDMEASKVVIYLRPQDVDLLREVVNGVSGDLLDNVRIEATGTSQPTTAGGGNLANGCSSAFMIKSSATSFGVLSAGHSGCNGSTTYLSGNITTTALHASAFGYRDRVLQKLSSGSPSNDLYISISPYIRDITSARYWNTLVVNDLACKQVRTTGYGCGKIKDKYYKPSYIPSSDRFLRMDIACDSGDSGGSWFYNNAAYGVQSGKTSTNLCIFGSISWAIPSGYNLVTS